MLAVLVWQACKPDKPEPPTPVATSVCGVDTNAGTPYALQVPYFFSDPLLPDFNPLTEEGVELGRYLFWEKRLSRTNTVSCASCHLPGRSFADSVAFSVGVHGDVTERNSMALINQAWNNRFFWDGRSTSLEAQILVPVAHPDEMDLTWPEAVERIKADDDYVIMFDEAFGSPCVDSVRMSYAIAQFVRTLISANSKFDQVVYYGMGQLSPSEQRGLELFLAEGGDPEVVVGGQGGGDCFHCHGGALTMFMDNSFHNNGLDSEFSDLGRYYVTGLAQDKGVFKTPTLRNVEVTGPYMHDGRFQTLEEVVEHYNSGGHLSATLDPMMKFPNVGLQLSEQDKTDLVNFLKTLTDEEFISNPAFSDPH